MASGAFVEGDGAAWADADLDVFCEQIQLAAFCPRVAATMSTM